MPFGKTWTDRDSPEFWDWMDAQRKDSALRHALLDLTLPHEKVTEIGCGAGHFLEALVGRGWEGTYRGYDFSAAALEMAKERRKQLGVKAYFYQGNFMERRTQRSDIVVACGVLQHQPEWLPMVERALEVAPIAAFGVGYVGGQMQRTDHGGHYDWVFNPQEAIRQLPEGVKVLESQVLPNPLRQTRRWKTEWLLVVARG